MPGIAVSTGSFAGRKKARRLFTTVASSLIAALSGFTTAVAGGTSTAVESPSGTVTLTVDASNNMAYADKQVTGLTIGKTYELSVRNTHATFSAQVSIGTTQGGTQTGVNGFFALANIVSKVTFVATATTHWIRFYRGAQGTVTLQEAAVRTREVPAWALGGLPIIDLDFENSRFLINGKVFTRIADMISAGALLYNVSGTMIFKLDTPLNGATYHRCDHTNDNTTNPKTLFEYWDSATGGNLGATTPQNSMGSGWFWDGANRVVTWGDVVGGVDQTAGTSWLKTRPAATRGYIATRNNTNLHTHTCNDQTIQTDTSAAIPTGLDRLVIGNRRTGDRPSNTGTGGETIHRFTAWEGVTSDTVIQALSTRQRTNMMSYSDDVSNAVWAKTATNVTGNATPSPDWNINTETELFPLGNFSSNLTGFAAIAGGSGVITSGELVITAAGGNYPGVYLDVPVTIGKTYRIAAKGRRGTSASSALCRVYDTSFATLATPLNNTLATDATGEAFYTATVSTLRIAFQVNAVGATGTCIFDDVSVREVNSTFLTADLLTETLNTAIVTHAVNRAIPGWVYTGYFDLKAGTATWVRVIFGNPTTNGFEMWVNLATGAKGTIQARGSGWALIDSAVTPLANGFHRCRITFVPSDNAIGASVMSATADASATKAVATYYVGGVQVSRSNDIEPYVARAA